MARIVVIDDDETMRMHLVEVMERLGHEVISEANGRAGLERVRAWRPAIVITDMLMPEKEGVETILDIRREFPTIKVIAMSGGGSLSGADYLQLARRFGANYTLAKPFSSDELRIALHTVLPHGTPHPSSETSPSHFATVGTSEPQDKEFSELDNGNSQAA